MQAQEEKAQKDRDQAEKEKVAHDASCIIIWKGAHLLTWGSHIAICSSDAHITQHEAAP